MAKGSGPRELFRHELRRDGRIVALLWGVEGESGGVTVETEVHPAATRGAEPERRPFAFATRDQAARFVEEALYALQYLGCAITQ